jgi:hypothetical protein
MDYEESARAIHKSGSNCSVSVFTAYAELLGVSDAEAKRMAPKPRSEGGLCGAYLAGKKILEQLKPEAIREYDRRFIELNGMTECKRLLKSQGASLKSCNDYVGDVASIVEDLLENW